MRASWACSAARWRREAQKLAPELERELLLLLLAVAVAVAAVVAGAAA